MTHQGSSRESALPPLGRLRGWETLSGGDRDHPAEGGEIRVSSSGAHRKRQLPRLKAVQQKQSLENTGILEEKWPNCSENLGKLAPAVGFEPTTNGLTVRCATAAPRRNKPYPQRRCLSRRAAGAALVGDRAWHITRVWRVASPFRRRSHKTGCCSLEGRLL